jgi:hypothetical protein
MSADSLEVCVSRGSESDFASEFDSELDSFLDTCPESFAQQTPSWRDVITRVEKDEAIFLTCRRAGRLVGLLPTYRFVGPKGSILTSVPLPGPLGGIATRAGEDRAPIFAALLDRCLQLAVSLECDLVTVITNPFRPDAELYSQVKTPDFILDNALQALNLTEDVALDGTLLKASSSLLRNLRRARASGLVVDDAQTLANVEEWYAIHEKRHRQLGATPLPRELFHAALEHAVPSGRARFFFIRRGPGGEMAAGGLYLCHGSVVDAFMPSMDDRHASERPNHLLAAHSIAWARSAGYRFYNWQGSPPEGGVERFKRSWGSRRFEYCFLTWITGDTTAFLDATVNQLIEEYRWHYVLPFDRLGGAKGAPTGHSQRSDTWKLQEQAK